MWEMMAKIIEMILHNSVSTTCTNLSYQPKMPKNIEKFKK